MTLGAMEKCAGFFTATEQRIRTRADRFRVPDVCVVLEKPSGAAGRRVVTDPPYLCVEILSPEDTAQEVRDKVGEYLTFGVKWVWVIDPITCGGEIYTVDKIFSLKDRVFTTDRFRVDLNQVEF